MVIFLFVILLIHLVLAIYAMTIVNIFILLIHLLLISYWIYQKRYKWLVFNIFILLFFANAIWQIHSFNLQKHSAIQSKPIWVKVVVEKPLVLSSSYQLYKALLIKNKKSIYVKHYGNQSIQTWPQRYLVLCQFKLKSKQYLTCSYKKMIPIPIHHWFNQIKTIKSHWVNWVWKSQGGEVSYRILIALVFGIRAYLTPQIWHVFSVTGTAHLLAIAGLHLGVIIVINMFILGKLWNVMPWLQQLIIKPFFLVLSAIVISLIYSCFTGFEIPCQRAAVMYLVICLATLGWVNLTMLDRLLMAVIVILIIHPLDILHPGLWLSFLSILTICYGMQQSFNQRGYIFNYLHLSMILALGLLPWTLYFFGSYAWLGFLANFIAIPVVAFFILPIAVMSCLLIPYKPIWQLHIWHGLAYLLKPLWLLLVTMSYLKLTGIYQSITIIDATLFFIGFMYLMAPIVIVGRYWAILLMLPVFMNHLLVISYGSVNKNVIQLNHQNMILVNDKQHVWLISSKHKKIYLDQWDLKKVVHKIGIMPIIQDIQTLDITKLPHVIYINGRQISKKALFNQLKTVL